MLIYEILRIVQKPINLVVLLLLPIVLAIIGNYFFSSLAGTELKIGVFSEDRSPLSKLTVGVVMSLFQGGTIAYTDENYKERLNSGEFHAVVIIPKNFTSNLFSAKPTEIKFVPSPVDLQFSAAAYIVLQKLFEDLSGGPFFNPKVLGLMYTSSSVPAPTLVTSNNLDFASVFGLPVVLLTTMFIALFLGTYVVSHDRSVGFTKIFAISKYDEITYFSIKFLTINIIASTSGIIALILITLITNSVPFYLTLSMIFFVSLIHSAIGLIISSFSKSSIQSIAYGIGVGLFFFLGSGALTPNSTLPVFLTKIVRFMPISMSILNLRLYQINRTLDIDYFFSTIIITLFTVLAAILIVSKELSPKRR